MSPFKVKDNCALPKNDFSSVQNVVNRIADKTLRELEREGVFVFPRKVQDAPDIEEEQVILQSYNACYRTSNIMGFIGYGKIRYNKFRKLKSR